MWHPLIETVDELQKPRHGKLSAKSAAWYFPHDKCVQYRTKVLQFYTLRLFGPMNFVLLFWHVILWLLRRKLPWELELLCFGSSCSCACLSFPASQLAVHAIGKRAPNRNSGKGVGRRKTGTLLIPLGLGSESYVLGERLALQGVREKVIAKFAISTIWGWYWHRWWCVSNPRVVVHKFSVDVMLTLSCWGARMKSQLSRLGMPSRSACHYRWSARYTL